MMTRQNGISIRSAVVLGAMLFGVAVPNVSWANVCVYRPPKVRQLHGVVLDTSNEPIQDVVVTLMMGEKIIKLTTTNEAGEFDFRSLPDGKYKIDASAGGFHHARYLVILSHQTSHWTQSIQIKLAFGGDQCEGTIEVAGTSAGRH
jgi:hypothetical protein